MANAFVMTVGTSATGFEKDGRFIGGNVLRLRGALSRAAGDNPPDLTDDEVLTTLGSHLKPGFRTRMAN